MSLSRPKATYFVTLTVMFAIHRELPVGLPLVPDQIGDPRTKDYFIGLVVLIAVTCNVDIKISDVSNPFGGHVWRLFGARHLARIGVPLPITSCSPDGRAMSSSIVSKKFRSNVGLVHISRVWVQLQIRQCRFRRHPKMVGSVQRRRRHHLRHTLQEMLMKQHCACMKRQEQRSGSSIWTSAKSCARIVEPPVCVVSRGETSGSYRWSHVVGGFPCHHNVLGMFFPRQRHLLRRNLVLRRGMETHADLEDRQCDDLNGACVCVIQRRRFLRVFGRHLPTTMSQPSASSFGGASSTSVFSDSRWDVLSSVSALTTVLVNSPSASSRCSWHGADTASAQGATRQALRTVMVQVKTWTAQMMLCRRFAVWSPRGLPVQNASRIQTCMRLRALSQWKRTIIII